MVLPLSSSASLCLRFCFTICAINSLTHGPLCCEAWGHHEMSDNLSTVRVLSMARRWERCREKGLVGRHCGGGKMRHAHASVLL